MANLRENYVSSGIDETALPQEPHVLMAKWVEEACGCKEVSGRVSSSLGYSPEFALDVIFCCKRV